MAHPFERLSTRLLGPMFWPLLVFTLSLMLVFLFLGAPLDTSAAPNGIVSFELAGSVSRASEILASWDDSTKVRAAFLLGLDYLFLLVYSTTIAIACIWSARVLGRHNVFLAALGKWLAWGLWLAALLDAVENAALAALLFGRLSSPLPQLAWAAAVIKFGLILAGMLYCFAAAWVFLTGRRRPTARATF